MLAECLCIYLYAGRGEPARRLEPERGQGGGGGASLALGPYAGPAHWTTPSVLWLGSRAGPGLGCASGCRAGLGDTVRERGEGVCSQDHEKIHGMAETAECVGCA